MKILLINGSPKGNRSNSLRLAHSFIEGIRENGEVFIDELNISKMNIESCRGCFSCWKATPGECIIKDDMTMVIEKEVEADIIIWSFPLYYFSVPGILKDLIDRQLPMYLPFMSENDGGIGVVGHEMDIGTEVVFGRLFGVPMELVLKLVAAKIFEFGNGRAGVDLIAADGGVGISGVVEFAAFAA